MNYKKKKERTIEDALKMCCDWKSIHDLGVRSLEIAATLIEVPRKTLEDYSLIIRRALSFGFDLSKNRKKKMGFLRKFIKEAIY